VTGFGRPVTKWWAVFTLAPSCASSRLQAGAPIARFMGPMCIQFWRSKLSRVNANYSSLGS